MSTPAPAPPGSGIDPAKGMFPNAPAALTELRDYYKGWTAQLTQRSFELSMAVIVANWSVSGGLNNLLLNPWAKASVAVVVIGLAATLLATWKMGELLRAQVKHAATSAAAWEQEWQQFSGRANPWPFTDTINKLGSFQRLVKAFVPILGGVLFLCALLFP